MYATNIGIFVVYGAYDDDAAAAAGTPAVPIGGSYYSPYDGLLRIRQV